MKAKENLLAYDNAHVWHPYNRLNPNLSPYLIEKAQGVYLYLKDGRQLIDGMSSWWSAIHGYHHPVLNQAITSQLNNMAHVMFGGLTHEPAILLSERLLNITEHQFNAVFFADSGSVSVEVGLKMSLQYWDSLGINKKKKFLTVQHGYHGDTFGAMSVCDPINGMHQRFQSFLAQNIFVKAPNALDENDDGSDIRALEQALQQNHEEIAAIIIEPLVQGAGGMRFYRSSYLNQLRQLADHYNVLLIFDEIATGFARTGTLFAFQQSNIAPDILCLGKALSGGYLSFAAILCNEKVSDGLHHHKNDLLMHGPTFMANPLACAVSNASIDLLLSQNWQTTILAIEKQLESELSSCSTLDCVNQVRVKGAIGVVELKQPLRIGQITPILVELGVWLRPFNKLLYIMPPYIITKEQLKQLTDAMYQGLNQYQRTLQSY